MIPWERLSIQDEEYGVLGVAEGVCSWRVRSALREVRQAMYAAATFWKAWLDSCSESADCSSNGYLVDEDLHLLYKGIGEADIEGTPARLHAVKALGMQELYFVDVGQWREALRGMEAVVLIPILSDDVVALILEHFSEETREVVVEDRLIAPRFAQG